MYWAIVRAACGHIGVFVCTPFSLVSGYTEANLTESRSVTFDLFCIQRYVWYIYVIVSSCLVLLALL